MKKCNSKIKHTCGIITYSTCTAWEGDVNSQSDLVDETCLDQELIDQDQYNQLEEIWNQVDLSELGDACLEYLTDENDKIVVKNVLLKHEEEICLLKNRVTELENRPICDMPLGDCINTSCLTDPCGNDITTWGQLVQALVNNNCETP